MYELIIKSGFSGAHYLRGYRGKCEKLHGHNWKVEVKFEKSSLNNIGIASDFKILKSKLNKVLIELDHSLLNSLTPFKKINPSAENIARYIFNKLKSSIKQKSLILTSVSVWESENSCAIYYDSI